MTTETQPIQERSRPRIVETEETGRLDLRLPVVPDESLAPAPPRRVPSPFAVAMTGLGILVVGVAGIDLAQFVDDAFAHGTGVGVLAAVAVAAGAAFLPGRRLRISDRCTPNAARMGRYTSR